MFRLMFYSFFTIFVMCSFCGKEFRSLGRDSWRCKEKIKRSDNEQTKSDKASQQEELDSTNEKECVSSISKSSPVKCCCGKTCNGLRGLKLHHCSCRVVQGLGDNQLRIFMLIQMTTMELITQFQQM